MVAYCKPENKVDLGFVEGLNDKIRVIQRRAYGLRDEEYARLKILTGMLRPICAKNDQNAPTRLRENPKVTARPASGIARKPWLRHERAVSSAHDKSGRTALRRKSCCCRTSGPALGERRGLMTNRGILRRLCCAVNFL